MKARFIKQAHAESALQRIAQQRNIHSVHTTYADTSITATCSCGWKKSFKINPDEGDGYEHIRRKGDATSKHLREKSKRVLA